MRANKPERDSITPKTAEQATAVLTLDLVGLAEAAELAGIGRAAFSLRRSRHANLPSPVAELRCGPVWFRWQIQSYLAEERRLGRRGWYGRRVGAGRRAAAGAAFAQTGCWLSADVPTPNSRLAQAGQYDTGSGGSSSVSTRATGQLDRPKYTRNLGVPLNGNESRLQKRESHRSHRSRFWPSYERSVAAIVFR